MENEAWNIEIQVEFQTLNWNIQMFEMDIIENASKYSNSKVWM